MEKKVIPLSILMTLVGLLGLVTLQLIAAQREELWYHFMTHLFSLVGSAGLVGLIFESMFRKEAIDQFARLFDGDPHFAAALSQDARQRRVRNTLKAQLGSEIGEALYDGVVSRYLVANSPYKKQFVYEAVLADLAADVKLAPNVILAKSAYYRLTMTERFQRPFRHAPSRMQIGCILTDDFPEVDYWFSKKNCIFRETLVLSGGDRDAVRDLFSKLSAADLLRAVSLILTIEKVSINGTSLEIVSAAMAPSGNSVGIVLKVPRSLTIAAQAGSLAWYEITISGLIAKSARKYPVILAEPTEDPMITLRYPAAGIQRMVAAPFFTGQDPFKPRIAPRDDLRQITVSFPRIQDKHVWVFPSGTIFLWDH
jgi:hypothetical protein